MLTRIDHIGIACHDLDATVEFYRATYGFEVFHTEVNEEQGVREAMLKINETSDGGASYLQLLEPTREDSAVGKWLAKNGEGRSSHRVRHRGRRRRRAGRPRQGRPGPLRRCHAAVRWVLASPSSTRRTATAYSPNWSPPHRSTELPDSRPGRVDRPGPGPGRGALTDDLTPFPGGPFAANGTRSESCDQGTDGTAQCGATNARRATELTTTTSRGSKPRWTG